MPVLPSHVHPPQLPITAGCIALLRKQILALGRPGASRRYTAANARMVCSGSENSATSWLAVRRQSADADCATPAKVTCQPLVWARKIIIVGGMRTVSTGRDAYCLRGGGWPTRA